MLSITVIQRTIGFGRSILLCRWLPPEELGHWDLTLAFLDLAAPFAVLSIPACFLRYVEHYRQRGHLRVFLRRMAMAVLASVGCSIVAMSFGQSWLSEQLYNSDQGLPLVRLVILTLAPLVVFNTVIEVFGSLRMYPVVSLLTFVQSLLFAGVTLSLVAFWHAGADSIIIGYGLTCLLCDILPLYWLVRMWANQPHSPNVPAALAFWGRLVPFISSVWVINLLENVFAMTDRYMLLHYSQMAAGDAAVALGQYHSARVFPLLIMQLAAMVGAMFVPYWSHDWEAGRREQVRARLDLFLKVLGLGLTAAAAIVLLVAPFLFVSLFGGKFAGGESIHPWTLLSAVWFSMFCVANTYFWCNERVWQVSLILLFSLAVNAITSIVLLPRLGLFGAVLSAAIADVLLLIAVYGLGAMQGMRVSQGTWIVSAAPAALAFGAWTALTVLVALVLLSLTTRWIFTSSEKTEIIAFSSNRLDRLRFLFGRWRTAANPLEANGSSS
jgi:O-antigen/teichoic acid export membrane protein